MMKPIFYVVLSICCCMCSVAHATSYPGGNVDDAVEPISKSFGGADCEFSVNGPICPASNMPASSPSSDTSFVTHWQVNSFDTIIISTPNANYDFDFKWRMLGDTFTLITGTHSGADGDFVTQLGFGGTYQLEITGSFPHLKDYPKNKLIDVVQWGNIVWTSFESTFADWPGADFSATDAPILTSVIRMSKIFQNASNFNGNIDHWDVSNVERMDRAFQGATAFDQPLGSWNVANVTTMERMFLFASSFNQDIGGWNVANVGRMDGMFQGATVFNQNIGGWIVSNVSVMASMFANATAFDQPIGGWDVSNVRSMSGMFSVATVFDQDIGGWNVSAVTEMRNLFRSADRFNQDIGGWDVSAATDMKDMFRGCDVFNQDISNWDVSSVQNMRQMFDNANSFNQPIGKWDVRNVLTFREMFRQNTSFNQSLGGWQFHPEATFLAFLNNATGFDCNSWSSTIVGWNFNNPQLRDMSIGGPNTAEYDSLAARARNELVARGWSVGGLEIADDCGVVHQFNCTDSLGLRRDTLFGPIVMVAERNITLDSILFDSTSVTSCTAGESATMGPGFEVALGAEFEATIGVVSCAPDTNVPTRRRVSASKSSNTAAYATSTNHTDPTAAELSPVSRSVPDLALTAQPNPFRGYTTIIYQLPEATTATLELYDQTGRLWTTLLPTQVQPSGRCELQLSNPQLPEGLYYLVLRTERARVVRKVVVY